MANCWIDFAWSTDLTGTEKLALLAICDHADEDGFAFPGYDRLAQYIGTTRRQAIRVIAKLTPKYLLIVKRGGGIKPQSEKRGASNLYLVVGGRTAESIERITARQTVTPMSPFNSVAGVTVPHRSNGDIQGTETVTSGAGNGDIQGAVTVTPMSPEPMGNHHIEPNGNHSSVGNGFSKRGLKNLRLEDLSDTGRLLRRHREAVESKLCQPGEHSRIQFVALAEYALEQGPKDKDGDSVRLFAWLIKPGNDGWNRVRIDDEERASRRIRAHESREYA